MNPTNHSKKCKLRFLSVNLCPWITHQQYKLRLSNMLHSFCRNNYSNAYGYKCNRNLKIIRFARPPSFTTASLLALHSFLLP